MSGVVGRTEESYLNIFEAHPQPMWVCNATSQQIVAVNKAATTHYGYTREEFLNLTLNDLCAHKKCARPAGKDTVICRHKTKDGRLIEVEMHRHPVAFGGRACELVSIFDVSRSRWIEQRCQVAECRLRALLDALPECLMVLSRDGSLLEINPVGMEKLGKRTVAEARRCKIDSFLAQGEAQPFQQQMREVLQGKAVRFSCTMIGAEGTPLRMDCRAVLLPDVEEHPQAVLLLATDTTREHEALAALTQSEARFREVFEQTPAGIALVDAAGVVMDINEAGAKFLGSLREKVRGTHYATFIHPEEMEDTTQIHRGLVAGEIDRWAVDRRFVRADKEVVWGRLSFCAIRDAGGWLRHTLVLCEDITERKRLEHEVLHISDRERARLGQELHDEICQALVTISLLSNLLRDALRQRAVPEAEDADKIHNLVLEAASKTRMLARGLYQPDLEGNGFMAAVEGIIQRTQQLFGIECVLECNEPVVFISNTAAGHVCRIIQEAVHNAVKHSGCSRLELRMAFEHDALQISVTDNGCGLSAAGTAEKREAVSLGFQGMHYRAAALGGNLMICTPEGGGLAVRLAVPLRLGHVVVPSPARQ